jgi:hypothetical protein
MIELQLTASDFQLELYVDGYEFPDFNTGRDGNALACEIELDLRRRLDLHAAHAPLILYNLRPGQLRRINSAPLEHAPDGEATLGDPDEQSGDEFGLTIRLNDQSATLEGFLTDSATTRLNLRDDRHRPVVPQRHTRAVRHDPRRVPRPRRHHRRLSRVPNPGAQAPQLPGASGRPWRPGH